MIHVCDVLEGLGRLPDESVQCCVTSPPYYGLRSYLPADHPLKRMEIGQERSYVHYLSRLAAVSKELRRVLRDDGLLWLNVGDAYATKGYKAHPSKCDPKKGPKGWDSNRRGMDAMDTCTPSGLEEKNLLMIPARVALAFQEAGWILRSRIVWYKPNPMPDSAKDRPTCAFEEIFLFSKQGRYYSNFEAIRRMPSEALLKQIAKGYEGQARKDFGAAGVQDASRTKKRVIENARKKIDKQRGHSRRHQGFNERWDHLTREEQMAIGGNIHNVWVIPTKGFKGAHFATFPPEIPRRCILASTRPGDVVLDPFVGSGTTAMVADRLGRKFVGIELDPRSVKMAHERIASDEAREMCQQELLEQGAA